jgi:hypothetical protein
MTVTDVLSSRHGSASMRLPPAITRSHHSMVVAIPMHPVIGVVAGEICYETGLSIFDQLELLKPLLGAWDGDDFQHYYLADHASLYYCRFRSDRSLTVGRNASYATSTCDRDRFTWCLNYIDTSGAGTDDGFLQGMRTLLQIFWQRGIATCTPAWASALPNHGGRDGPVAWPGSDPRRGGATTVMELRHPNASRQQAAVARGERERFGTD